MEKVHTYTAFAGAKRIATGGVEAVVSRIKQSLDADATARVLIFDDLTGEQIDFDLRGTLDEALARLASHPALAARRPPPEPPARSGPGRPRLGVVSREVSLLPRHWEWLERQPGGLSVALRRLVDAARQRGHGAELARRTREGAGRFMWALAGDLPDFEEATRALFARDDRRLSALIRGWPGDIREHIEGRVAEAARLERADASDPSDP